MVNSPNWIIFYDLPTLLSRTKISHPWRQIIITTATTQLALLYRIHILQTDYPRPGYINSFCLHVCIISNDLPAPNNVLVPSHAVLARAHTYMHAASLWFITLSHSRYAFSFHNIIYRFLQTYLSLSHRTVFLRSSRHVLQIYELRKLNLYLY